MIYYCMRAPFNVLTWETSPLPGTKWGRKCKVDLRIAVLRLSEHVIHVYKLLLDLVHVELKVILLDPQVLS